MTSYQNLEARMAALENLVAVLLCAQAMQDIDLRGEALRLFKAAKRLSHKRLGETPEADDAMDQCWRHIELLLGN